MATWAELAATFVLGGALLAALVRAGAWAMYGLALALVAAAGFGRSLLAAPAMRAHRPSSPSTRAIQARTAA